MSFPLRPGTAEATVLLPRPDLVAAVLGTPPGGTCLLSATPGSGRRTLLREALGDDATWIRVGRAVEGVDQWRAGLRAALEASDRPERDTPAARLAMSPRPWLVLEDVEPSAPETVLREVTELVADCPATHRIALTTSHDIHNVVSGAARRGILVQLEDADLALRPAQARQLLEGLDPTVRDDEADAIVSLADGWCAALVAAGRRRAADPPGDSAAWLAGRGARLLWGPWWDGLPDEARTVLLDSAFVPVLEPSLVEELARSVPDAAAWLPRLARDHGPLREVSSTHGPVAYRRHPLLTTLVRAQAAGRSDEAELRRIAARWYGARGELALQVENLMAAGERSEALAVVEENVNDLMVEGQAGAVRAWYEAIGVEGFRDSAGHYLRTGWAASLMRDRTAARVALGRLRVLASLPGPAEEEQQVLRGEAAVLDAYLAQLEGNPLRSLRSTVTAGDCFGSSWDTNSRQFVPLLAARALLVTGDVVGASRTLAKLDGRTFSTGAFGESQHPALEAEVAWAEGRVHASREWAARQRRWLHLQEPDGWLQEVHGAGASYWLVASEDGRTEEALAGLLTAEENATANGNVTDRITVLLAFAEVHLASGDVRSSLERSMRARDLVLAECPQGGLLPSVLLVEARARVRAGDSVRAERLLGKVPKSTERQLISARIALQRSATGVGRALAEMRARTPREQAELALLLAWSQMQVSPMRTEQLLLTLADLAAEHGMTTVLVGAPDPLLAAARRAARHFVHDYLLELVRRAEQSHGFAHTASPTAVALSRGELQLLSLLPSRASNAGLAAELHVSVNTIKTRLRRLYLKLDVHDRDEAVAWARQRGLVPEPQRG